MEGNSTSYRVTAREEIDPGHTDAELRQQPKEYDWALAACWKLWSLFSAGGDMSKQLLEIFALVNSLKSQIMLLNTIQAVQTSPGTQGSQDCSSFVSWLTVDHLHGALHSLWSARL